MIFCGSMQEMKRRLRHDDFTLELEAAAEVLERLAAEVGQVPGVDGQRRRPDRRWWSAWPTGTAGAAALAEVLRLVAGGRTSRCRPSTPASTTPRTLICNCCKRTKLMDSTASISTFATRLMPFLAILRYDLRTLLSSWLVRLWLAGSVLLTLLLIAVWWRAVADGAN